MRRKGFTLMELMVVIVILGVLVSFIAPRLLERPQQAREVATRMQLKGIQAALELFTLDNGFLPTTDQGLESLIAKPEIPPEPKNYNEEGYLKAKNLPKDGWKNDFFYICPGIENRYELYSLGADGKEGGERYDKDIHVWDLE